MQKTLCRFEKKEAKSDGSKDHSYFNVKSDIGTLMCFLKDYDIEITPGENGWLDINCTMGAFKYAAEKAALHLINRRNPNQLPNYVHEILRSQFEFEPLAETG